MPPVLFISDLHLHPSRPNITRLFLDFLAGRARKCSSLYILGDLFEFWIGDDDDRGIYDPVVEGIRKLTVAGIPVMFMHGNRDFLVGDRFAEQTGLVLLPDPELVVISGTGILLMHGDTLCTDDKDYQSFRQEVRSAAWTERVLNMPVSERLEYFHTLREASRKSIAEKAMDIMDVNRQAVRNVLEDSGADVLVHGHTHRPGMHDVRLHDRMARRIVLGDWYSSGSVLELADGEFKLETIHP